MAAHRIGQRYGNLLQESMAHTVANEAEVDGEPRHLFALLNE